MAENYFLLNPKVLLPFNFRQPFFVRETAGAAAPETGPLTPIIAGEQQLTTSVIIVYHIR
jgi:hypothetical protein